jgi:hypothetical protein
VKRRFLFVALLLAALSVAAEPPKPARLVKVLAHYLDREGRHSVSPSLYDRDAYQAHLRRTPSERGGLRWDVQWKAAIDAPLTLRVEARGTRANKTTSATLETPLKRKGWSRRWTSLALREAAYQEFGELLAWRVTLWQGDTLLSEQKSFLW